MPLRAWGQQARLLSIRVLGQASPASWLRLLAALLVLAVAGTASYRGTAAAAADAAAVERAQRVEALLASLQGLVLGAESAQRGAALSGDPTLMEPHRQAKPLANAQLDELRTLAASSAEQHTRLVALGPLLDQRLEQLAATTEARGRGGPGAPQWLDGVEGNRRTRDRLDIAFAALQSQGRIDLASARQRSQDSASRASSLGLLNTVLALGVAGWALLLGQHTAGRLRRQRSERLSDEGTLRHAALEHRGLLASPLAPVCFVDAEGRILRSNAACEQLWGWRPEDVAGTPFIARAVPEDQRRTERMLAAAAGNAEPQTFDHRCRHADGRGLHLQWSVQVIGEDGLLVCVGRDLTPADALGRQLARQEQTAQQASSELARATERLDAAERRLTEFLATLGRCLQQPLGVIIQQAGNGQQGLLDAPADAATRAWTRVLDCARDLQEVVDNVLDMGRVQAGQLALKSEAFDVWETINHTVDLVRGPAARKGLDMPVRLADDLGYAHGDTQRVAQALANVLRDAVAATAQGEVAVSAIRQDGLLRVEVADARAHAAAQDLDDLLAPLHDVSLPATAGQITQLLGLATARGLLQCMGGDLRASRQPPGGMVFVLTLPADVRLGESEAPFQAAAASAPAPSH